MLLKKAPGGPKIEECGDSTFAVPGEGGGAGVMHWNDRVYGEATIDDPRLLALISGPTFQRLRGIRQAGPSAFAFPFKTVTRYEHSLGVHLLLRVLGADLREQVAGLLHDLSHTAFSHAVDFVFASDEQNYHEHLKHEFLHRDDIVRGLRALGYTSEDFADDSIYPLLERPIPWLCADRVDYFFRDGLACGVMTPDEVAHFRTHLAVVDRTIVVTDVTVARAMVAHYATMNRQWWAGPTEAFIYNEFADALKEGLRLGIIVERDLLTDDDQVLEKLQAVASPLIVEKLDHILRFRPERVRDYIPRIIPKTRWLDPPVLVGSEVKRLSEWTD
jgi:HD superfamily phosphohydrolase